MCGHGRTNAELLKPFWEHDEARVIKEVTEVIEKYIGVRPTGWMGPGAVESSVTPDLLKEAGYTFLLDWPFDDQPIWMRTRSGPLLSVPYPLELNDAGTLVARDHSGREFADMMVDQFEEMLEASENATAGIRAVAARLRRRPAVPVAAVAPGDQTLRRAQACRPGLVHPRRGHRQLLLRLEARPYPGKLTTAEVVRGSQPMNKPITAPMTAPMTASEATARTHLLQSKPETVHWGYFDGGLPPVLSIEFRRPRHHRMRFRQPGMDAA